MRLKGYYINTADILLLLNVVLFALAKVITFSGLIEESELNSWVCVPYSLNLYLERPWTLFSYAFYHVSLSHLFWNMLFLFFTGRIFFNLFNIKQFLVAYIWGVLIGGAAFLVLGHFLPTSVSNTILLGASAGIISVFAFIATVTPSYGVYIFTLRVKVLYLLGAIILFDLFDFSANSGGKIAHLGGIIAGIMVGVMAKYQLWSRKRMRVEMPEMKPNKPERQKVKQHRINQLLDKINASGYASLTDKEKKFLFEASKENDM